MKLTRKLINLKKYIKRTMNNTFHADYPPLKIILDIKER